MGIVGMFIVGKLSKKNYSQMKHKCLKIKSVFFYLINSATIKHKFPKFLKPFSSLINFIVHTLVNYPPKIHLHWYSGLRLSHSISYWSDTA